MIEEFGLKLNKQVVLVLAVSKESQQTDEYQSLLEYLKETGCIELVPSVFLIGSNSAEVFRHLKDALGFMQGNDSAVAFNEVSPVSGARIWAPTKKSPRILISRQDQ